MNKKILSAVLVLIMLFTLSACVKQNYKKDTIEETGKYVGRIDNNSIEVTIDNEPKSFRLNNEIKQKLDNNLIKDGDNVVVVYYENEHNQFILESMEKVNE